jgi:hypothetical protein
MILRKVINAEQHVPYNGWALDLECGHRLEWVRVGRRFPARKRCQACELVQTYAATRPRTYCGLLELALKVPAEDRPRTMVEWVSHCLRAEELLRKIPGLDDGIALSLTEGDGAYPLPLHDDDWSPPKWLA